MHQVSSSREETDTPDRRAALLEGLSVSSSGPKSRLPARSRRVLHALGVAALAIPFAYLLVASVGPLVDQAVGSFFNWYAVHPQSFAGFRYYRAVLADPAARAALVHTGIYVAIAVPAELALGVGGAWLVFQARRGKAVFTTLYVLPLVIPWPSAAQLFGGILGFNGVLDFIRSSVFGDKGLLFWTMDPKLSFAVVVLAGIWKGTPWVFLLMLAAFSACPVALFEAGRVDGARGLAYWRHVVVPAVLPMLMFVTVFRLFAEAQVAQSVDLLTGGGPFGATQTVGTYANQLAFMDLEFPQSEALATGAGVVLLIGALVALATVYRSRLSRASRGSSPRRARWVATERPKARRGGTQPRRHIASPLAWFGRSQRRARRLVAVALVGGAVLALLPVTGGIPGRALRPEFQLVWPQVETGLANTAVMVAGTLVGTLLLAVPAAYVLARVRFRGRSALFGLVLLAMAIPGALTLFPQAQGLVHLGLTNTRLGVLLIYVAADLPVAAFFLRATFAAIPESYVEAMRVDGASTARIAAKLLFPLSVSTLVAVGILTVLQVLGDSLIMAVMTNGPSFYTLPVLVANGMAGTGSLGASWLTIGPPLLLFVAFQRHFQRGLLAGQLL